MSLSLTFLGTGTSHGIPMIACDCPVCTSSNSKNNRNRTSAVVSDGERTVLIDTTPELRLQAIAAGLKRVDAVVFTHAHADHIFGLDDIRRFNEIYGRDIPCYGREDTLKTIRQAFEYIFIKTQEGGGKPHITLNPVDGAFQTAGMLVHPIPVFHGELPIYGYRIGRLAYITDCSFIPGESWELLKDLDVLVLGALRPKPHPTHFNVEQAVEAAQLIGANRTYFTHITHRLEHDETTRNLPQGIELAYDGLTVDIAD